MTKSANLSRLYVENAWQLPELGRSTIHIKVTEYSEDVRATVRRIARNAIRETGAYSPHDPLYALDWGIGGARLSKRVSSYVFKNYHVKLPPETLEAIGSCAANVRDIVATYDITSAFDWNPGDYADSGSCYWGSFREARTRFMPRIGAVALRVYDNDSENARGNGRVWILPTGKVRGMFVSTNYYGACGTLSFTRTLITAILTEQFGGTWASKPVDLTVNGCYINDPQKYLFYPTDRTAHASRDTLTQKAERTSNIRYTAEMIRSIHYVPPVWTGEYASTDRYRCVRCYSRYGLTPETVYHGHGTDNGTYCHDCYMETYGECGICGYTHLRRTMREVGEINVCPTCVASHAYACAGCHRVALHSLPAYVHQREDAERSVGRWQVRDAAGAFHGLCNACNESALTCPTCNHRAASLSGGQCVTCNNRQAVRGRVSLAPRRIVQTTQHPI